MNTDKKISTITGIGAVATGTGIHMKNLMDTKNSAIKEAINDYVDTISKAESKVGKYNIKDTVGKTSADSIINKLGDKTVNKINTEVHNIKVNNIIDEAKNIRDAKILETSKSIKNPMNIAKTLIKNPKVATPVIAGTILTGYGLYNKDGSKYQEAKFSDELLTKEELIQGIRQRDKYKGQAKKGAIATAMLAATSAATREMKNPKVSKITSLFGAVKKNPKLSAATAIATVPALAYTLHKGRTASKYDKVIKSNKDLYKLNELEYGQLNYR